MKKNVLLVGGGSTKAATPNKSPWTQEEKNMFLQGMVGARFLGNCFSCYEFCKCYESGFFLLLCSVMRE